MMESTAHDNAHGFFDAYVDGEIAPVDEANLRAHLDVCPECRSELDRYASCVGLVREVGRERAPAGFVTAVMRRVRRRRKFDFGGKVLLTTTFPSAEAVVPILIAAAVTAAVIFFLLAR